MREAAGSALPAIAPSNAYRCADAWVLVAGNGDRIVRRLMPAIGRGDLAQDASLAHNAGRIARVGEIDAAVKAWTLLRQTAGVLGRLAHAAVPTGRVSTVRDLAEDPHNRARGTVA